MLLSELAEMTGLSLKGQDRQITGVNTLEQASDTELSFLVNPRYVSMLETTKAGAVILESKYADQVDSALVSENVYLDLARVVETFTKPQGSYTGISQLAYVHEEARLHDTVTVYPFAYVGPDVDLGRGVTVFSGCYIGEGCSVGEDSILYPNSVLMARTTLGRDCIVHPGAVIGSDGYGYAQGPEGHTRIPQVGCVKTGDSVDVGANTVIDRAALDTTAVGNGTKIDNLVQIAHNVQIGQHALIISQTGISGSSKVGNGAILAGQVGVADNVSIGDGVMIGAQAGIKRDTPAGAKVSGSPSMDIQSYLKVSAKLPKLPDLFYRVRRMEKELERLKKSTGNGEGDE